MAQAGREVAANDWDHHEVGQCATSGGVACRTLHFFRGRLEPPLLPSRRSTYIDRASPPIATGEVRVRLASHQAGSAGDPRSTRSHGSLALSKLPRLAKSARRGASQFHFLWWAHRPMDTQGRLSLRLKNGCAQDDKAPQASRAQAHPTHVASLGRLQNPDFTHLLLAF